jgi:hypothetical protein
MQATNVVTAGRLRRECENMGIDSIGSRSELADRLIANGIHIIDTKNPPQPRDPINMNKTTHISNVFIGPDAYSQGNNKLCISNKSGKGLISGDFKEETVTVNKCFSLENSENLTGDTPGVEGQIRRQGKDLFMYRSVGTWEGWYPMQFGPVRVI